ncbi:tetratricopeptide repeat-containing sensor histidine kinase [Danxiaibacter flavus]|uniref:histidine kinase n=1 Tax=Danxiaibacter flavus TaxID=3049108 RepID=A0ABV3ZLR1_9BACT|nr:tetratricopeptide repeat-containing sensor histidine kinase [Chitinophagaceae bacterium DXS]
MPIEPFVRLFIPNLLKRFCLIVILLGSGLFSFCQSSEINRIKEQLPLIEDSTRYADAINRLSTIYYITNLDSCYYLASDAYRLSLKLKYKKGMADAMNNLGIYYSLRTNTYLATKYYNQSLQIYKQLNDQENIAQLTLNIGLEFYSRGKTDVAEEYMCQAFDMGSRLKNDSIQSIIIANLLYYSKGLSKDSIKTLMSQGKAIATKYNDKRVLVEYAMIRSMYLLNEGRNDSAVDVLKSVEKESIEERYNFELVGIYTLLGQALAGKNPEKSVDYYKSALTIARDNDFIDLYLTSAETLYKIYTQNEDYHAAGTYAEIIASALKEYRRMVEQSSVTYFEYADTKQQLEAQKKESRYRGVANILLSIFIAAVIVLLAILYRSYQTNKRFTVALKSLNNRIYRKNRQLEENNRFKDRLISLLAHDFRQPFVSLTSLITVLRDHEALTKQEMEKVLESIENSSRSSVEIFENILSWIKKQLSGFVYDPVELNLKDMIDEATTPFDMLMKEKNVVLINNINHNTVAFADKEMLQFINRNLIHNAIKFSKPDSEIHVNATRNEKELIVSIRDFGAGMTKEKLDSLFNFFTTKTYSNNTEKGAGVALIICKDFLDKMQGSMWAQSELGKGSTFYFSFPVKVNKHAVVQ